MNPLEYARSGGNDYVAYRQRNEQREQNPTGWESLRGSVLQRTKQGMPAQLPSTELVGWDSPIEPWLERARKYRWTGKLLKDDTKCADGYMKARAVIA